jgi:hypothetical protein
MLGETVHQTSFNYCNYRYRINLFSSMNGVARWRDGGGGRVCIVVVWGGKGCRVRDGREGYRGAGCGGGGEL